MRERLEVAGWFLSSACNCGGTRKEEWQHSAFPGLIVKVYPKKGKYRASKGGRKQSEGNESQLQTYIDELAEKVV